MKRSQAAVCVRGVIKQTEYNTLTRRLISRKVAFKLLAKDLLVALGENSIFVLMLCQRVSRAVEPRGLFFTRDVLQTSTKSPRKRRGGGGGFCL